MNAVRRPLAVSARPAVAARATPGSSVQHIARRVNEAPATKPLLTVAVANLVMAAPAQAGALFDFNLTLPIQMAQFLLFMVFLDKTWFTPIGNLLEQRDADIRQRLANVKDNADEIERLQKEAERKLQEARDEVNNMIAEAKAEAEKEAAEEERKERERLDKELQQALDDLDKAKQQAEKELDSQIETLANDIVEQVLPKTSEPQAA